MDTDFSRNTKYTTKITQDSNLLGVQNELKRFALNQYLDKRDQNVLIGTSDTVADDDEPIDDLLLTNAVTEIYTGDNAHFEYFKVQNEHNESSQVSHTYIHQERGSNVQTNTITLHGGLVRNNLYVKLNGEGCENHAFGLFLTDKTQHVDNFIFVEHAKPNCNSTQLFKGILDDRSSGAFTGRILVSRDAQKTAAYQKNSSILLTDDVKMNSKPQLEIYADDVKCGHGGTVGQLDEDAMFYLRTRGIGEKEARLMLMYAFAYEILSEIKIEPLRDRMTELIDKRLRKELSQCNNCSLQCG